MNCRYCGWGVEEQYVEIDHIIPKSKGGPTRDHNLAVACPDCNGFKGPLTESLFLRKAIERADEYEYRARYWRSIVANMEAKQ